MLGNRTSINIEIRKKKNNNPRVPGPSPTVRMRGRLAEEARCTAYVPSHSLLTPSTDMSLSSDQNPEAQRGDSLAYSRRKALATQI